MNQIPIISKYLYAAVIITFALQHFIYARFVATLVPAFIPFHLFWAYFTGIALLAAGINIIINKLVKLSCLLLGAMLLIFILTVHIPILVDSHFSGSDITNAGKDIGLMCCAFIIAGNRELKSTY